jgi:NADP-dependent 3-hydroxy acid dehydrogenase YdfG
MRQAMWKAPKFIRRSGMAISGKTVLITGAARGIGRCTAEAFLARGATVVLTDVDAALLAQTAAELEKRGAVFSYPLDVCNEAAFSSLITRIEAEVSPVDILINNAGIMLLGEFMAHGEREDLRQWDINVRGVINGMRAVLPGMTRRAHGHIVNVASTAGKVGVPYAAVYSATKFAVVGLTEAVRQEHIESGVGFSYIMPTLVATDLIAGAGKLAWPPPLAPKDVAERIVSAVERGSVDVYVPGFVAVPMLLPSLLPRAVYETIGRLFKIDAVFKGHDQQARAAYNSRSMAPPASETAAEVISRKASGVSTVLN